MNFIWIIFTHSRFTVNLNINKFKLENNRYNLFQKNRIKHELLNTNT